ncbi:MAG: ABC transporter substrate-binding protein [Anaerolineae bacterium]
MRKKIALLLILALLAGVVAWAPPEQEKVTISALFMKQAGYQEKDIVAMTNEFQALHPNIDVELTFVSYEALHDKIVTAAAAKAGTYDVILLDCIWPAEFAEAGFLLDVTDRITEEMKKDIWPGALQAVTYKGHLYGMPWLNDVLYFYYNTEMLEKAGFDHPPRTWDELMEQGMAMKEKGIVEYPVIEFFAQAEGLVCDFVLYLFPFGGTFADEENNPTFNSPEGVAALKYMVEGMKKGLFNPASLESTYEEVRHTFSQGAAAFSFNWAYQYNLANDPAESQIAGKAEIALIPGGPGAASATTNGGMGLSIMADSDNPDEAWEYILYMSSKDVQKRYAQNALPIWISLFDDPEVLKTQPKLVELSKEQYKYMQNRPIVPFYSEMSQILQIEIQSALSGVKTPEQALADAEARILEVKKEYE